MDHDTTGVHNVEAAAEAITMGHEQPQHPQPQYQDHIEEAHASFFQQHQQLGSNLRQNHTEPQSPPQRASRPDVAAEDLELGGQTDDPVHKLQIAAQLSQALRNVTESPTSVQEGHYDQQVSSLDSLIELHSDDGDADMQSPDHHSPVAQVLSEVAENTQSGIQNDLQRALQQAIPQAEARQVSPPQHATLLPHSQHTYMPSPRPPLIAPAAPVGGVQTQYTLGDMTPPRKRSKVSRACDECRRKKVKCDATSETGDDETCSNCRRSNAKCLFSRVPQKRGPSKGYIKELADRINSIEGKLGGKSVAEALAGELASGRNAGESYAASALMEDSRKRNFAHISNTSYPTPASTRQPAWPADGRPAFPQPIYTANGLALKPILPRESINLAPVRSSSVRAGLVDTQAPQSVPHVVAVGEHEFDAYLNYIHHVLPFLPSSRDILNSHLAECRTSLQSAFVEALISATGSFPGSSSDHDSPIRAYRRLTDFDTEGGNHDPISHLVRLQCLILMIINVENYGPASLTGEHEGPSKVELLARAAGFAYFMGIPDEAMTMSTVADTESDECLRVRAWWTLIILDRWNAISSATRLVIPGDAVVLPHNLKAIFGEANYRFTLLAYIIGHWTPASVIAPLNSTPGDGARASATFHLNMEMWRADFPGDIPPNVKPVLHLSYWHCRLLAFLFMPSSLITDVTWAVRESVRLLTSHPQMVSPLNHHFTALTALCLIEMAGVDKSREEATQLLSNLVDANIAPSRWDETFRARIRHTLQPSSVQATASQSLRRLADLATSVEMGNPGNGNMNSTSGASEVMPEVTPERSERNSPKFRVSDNYADLGFDPREMLRTGYLNVMSDASI